jgi:hypothetical protein
MLWLTNRGGGPEGRRDGCAVRGCVNLATNRPYKQSCSARQHRVHLLCEDRSRRFCCRFASFAVENFANEASGDTHERSGPNPPYTKLQSGAAQDRAPAAFGPALRTTCVLTASKLVPRLPAVPSLTPRQWSCRVPGSRGRSPLGEVSSSRRTVARMLCNGGAPVASNVEKSSS